MPRRRCGHHFAYTWLDHETSDGTWSSRNILLIESNRLGPSSHLDHNQLSIRHGRTNKHISFLEWLASSCKLLINNLQPLVLQGRLSYSAYLIHLMVAIQFMGFSSSGLIFTSLVQAVSTLKAKIRCHKIGSLFLTCIIWKSPLTIHNHTCSNFHSQNMDTNFSNW